jgi:hypothetical protein
LTTFLILFQSSWLKYQSLREKRVNLLKQLMQTIQAEEDEFKTFSQEFRNGSEQWKTCVTQAEFSSAKINDHFLYDPERISQAVMETEFQVVRADHAKIVFTNYLKFMDDVTKWVSPLEKTKRKRGETVAKLEEAKGQSLRKNSQAAMRKVASLEEVLEASTKSKEVMVMQMRQQCLNFLNQVETVPDREMLRAAISSKLGDFGDEIVGGLVFAPPPPENVRESMRASLALPEYIAQDLYVVDELPKEEMHLEKSLVPIKEVKEVQEKIEPNVPPEEEEDDNQLEPGMEPGVDEVPFEEKELGEGGEPPEEFIDPITKKLMNDPVVLVADGNTYERQSILNWLETHDTSPVTGQVLNSKEMTPNIPIKKLIQEFKSGRPTLYF